MTEPRFIHWFREIDITDVALVGGKNASLGEMYWELTPRGIKIPNGFAVTAEGYWHFLQVGRLTWTIRTILSDLDTHDLTNLAERGQRVREAMLTTLLPEDLQQEIAEAYATLCTEYGPDTDVAVRSSATVCQLIVLAGRPGCGRSWPGWLSQCPSLPNSHALLPMIQTAFQTKAAAQHTDPALDARPKPKSSPEPGLSFSPAATKLWRLGFAAVSA